MRRLVLIILLLLYPFQVSLAMADQCCVTTPAGVTHHGTGEGTANAAPAFQAGDAPSALDDPHCPACVFGHLSGVPTTALALPGDGHQASAIASLAPFFTSPPAPRPERPKWAAERN